MNLFIGTLMGVYLTVGVWLSVINYKSNRLKVDLIEELMKQNELLVEQNTQLRGIIKKFGFDT